uniref:CSON013318 protein n=1 Tax=Culicoides sonorensis TaxID=179676 RepID=A0A336M7M6_CULSO
MEFGINYSLLKVVYYNSIQGPHWAFSFNYIIINALIWHRLNQLTKQVGLLNTHPNRLQCDKHKVIQYSSFLFNHLVICMDTLNEALWIQILINFNGIFMFNIFTIFGLYRTLFAYTHKLYINTLSRLIWNTSYLIFITIISIFGNMIESESKNLLVVIQRMMDDEKCSWSVIETASFFIKYFANTFTVII